GPLATEHTGRGVSPPVAGALVDGHDARRSELSLQVLERKRKWRVDVAGDAQTPRGHIDRRRRRGGIAHVKGVVRRDRGLEVVNGRFELRRARGQENEVAFLRVADERATGKERIFTLSGAGQALEQAGAPKRSGRRES